MTTSITFHGVACYEVAGPLGRVLIDPFLTGNPAADIGPEAVAAPDVILASHAAWDHMGDAAAIALRTGAPVICGTDTAALLRQSGVPESQIRVTVWGIRVRVGGITVHPVECHHWSQATLADGRVVTGTPMGFVVAVEEGVPVYHFGDTAVFSDLALIGRLHRPAVGLLGCTQPWPLVADGPGEVVTGEMSPEEAALAAEFLGVRYAVATHYDDHAHPDVKRFLELVPENDTGGRRVALAPAAGQTLVIDGDAHRLEDA
ncbi:MBL fold metallo-hydrolase [Actinomadura nitritigenes]|uniref:MBL fold metallo-hydrolase n=1 Tax=Actinomadura nitritigenes TaxID=134602 RepID=UPI003D8FEB71